MSSWLTFTLASRIFLTAVAGVEPRDGDGFISVRGYGCWTVR